MRVDFFDGNPVGDEIWGEIAKNRAIEAPRNNLLLQLGRVESSANNRDEVQKEFISFDTFWRFG